MNEAKINIAVFFFYKKKVRFKNWIAPQKKI